MKTTIKILLSASIVLLAYFCIMSIMSPIRFDQVKTQREKQVIAKLKDIRTAELEFKAQKGGFTDSFDELINFLKTAKKKTVMKEGTLTDQQLESGLTEEKAAKIVRSGNKREIAEDGLQGFRRDTAYVPMIPALFPHKYTADNIQNMEIIPFSHGQKFELKVNNTFMSNANIVVPIFEASATYSTYLSGLNHQELLNIIDLQKKLNKFPGLKVGSVNEPNNNAGNWE